ncbi:hypothetical protein I4U23_002095 [Adineta vaga]|nr:hypothetical protein I4U23_002095 [Adineta vaga]
MGKPNSDDSQFFDQTSSSSPIPPLPPPPLDFDMNWQTTLSQSEPSIQSRQNQILNRLATTAYNSSYKVSIGHERVNITDLSRQRDSSSDPTLPMISSERRRILVPQKGANTLSLCFMCFVSACLILIAITTMNLILKFNSIHNNPDMISRLLHSTNLTFPSIYMSPLDTVSNLILPTYDRTLREFATVICLSIIVLNCFCVLIFSIEIYLGCNIIQNRNDLHHCLFSSSTARFIAICSFYASIPAFILVMCIFILLNMSLIPAIVSLGILGCGLIFILLTLLTYVSLWQNLHIDGKLGGMNASIYHTVDATHVCDDEIDLAKTDELSTLV